MKSVFHPLINMLAERKTAIITGTSRDLGEYVALGLAQAGWDILGLYRNPQHDLDQAAIVKKVQAYKAKMVTIRADIIDKDTPNLIVAKLNEAFKGKAQALILNASGGYGKSLEEARKINVISQVRLIDKLLDNLIVSSVVVYNTSDPSHRFNMLSRTAGGSGEYNPVAQTKNEIEIILRARIPEFMERGIRLAVVVGNALDGSFVSRVLKRKDSQLVHEWQDFAEEGYFPTIMDMAVADLKIIRGNYPSGHTEYVGIKPEYQLFGQ